MGGTQQHNMMVKLIFAALFITIATAATSNVDEILPEDDVQSVEALVETNTGVGGAWVKCGKLSCATPTIYTGARVCKHKKKRDCQYYKSMNGKHWGLPITRCSKFSGKNCERYEGDFNGKARGTVNSPWCHELTRDSKKSKVCKCKGKNQTWKGQGKACFEGPNPPGPMKVCKKWAPSRFIKYPKKLHQSKESPWKGVLRRIRI